MSDPNDVLRRAANDVLRRAADEIDLDLGVRDMPRVPGFIVPVDGYVEAQWDRVAADLSEPGGYASVRALADGLRQTLGQRRKHVEDQAASERSVSIAQRVVARLIEAHGDVDAYELAASGSNDEEVWSLVEGNPATYELLLPTDEGQRPMVSEGLRALLRPTPGTTLQSLASGLHFLDLVSNAWHVRAQRVAQVVEYRLRLAEQALLEYEVFGVAVRHAERKRRVTYAVLGEEEEVFISRAVSGIRQVERQERDGMAARTVSALKEAILLLEQDPEPDAVPHTAHAVDRLFESLSIYRTRPGRGRPTRESSRGSYDDARAEIERLAGVIGLTIEIG